MNTVSFFFAIGQHSRDSLLITNLVTYLNCGTTWAQGEYTSYRVTRLEDIKSKIIPFFKQYPLQGIKRLNFEDFCEIMELVESQAHLTDEGLDKITKIKERMNYGRG